MPARHPAEACKFTPDNFRDKKQKSMAYPALRKFSYWGQFGVLIAFTGAGFIIGSVVSLIPFWGKMDTGSMQGASARDLMEKILVPENAGLLRLVQFISTFFIFFLPAFFYAKFCHRRAVTHLGYRRPVNIAQLATVVVIMLACLPLAGALGQLTEMMPFSDATLQKFKKAEDDYLKQIEVIGRMNNFTDYLVSLFMLAILPALFEETLFRGGLQNLLSRWIKLPALAIIITSLVFSAVHFSYIGFLSRVVLGFLLGWMYHRTGNLWLSIIGHMVHNGVAITALYVMRLKDPAMKIADAGPQMPLWTGLISLGVVLGLLFLFEKVNQYQVEKPGEELVMQHTANNPFV